MAARARRRRASRRRVAVAVCGWGLSVVLVFYALCTAGLLYMRYFDPPWTVVQVQRYFEARTEPARAARRYTFVPLARIAAHLRHAVIAAEDARFYQHRGVDWEGITRAAEDNWRRGRLWRGGSTVTQQLVKNLFLTTRGSMLRKIAELPLAGLAELILSKERIIELYLNVVEWGEAVYGAEAAARQYYGVPAARLSREQAARLAACLPAPRSRTPQRMDRSASVILRRMASMGW